MGRVSAALSNFMKYTLPYARSSDHWPDQVASLDSADRARLARDRLGRLGQTLTRLRTDIVDCLNVLSGSTATAWEVDLSTEQAEEVRAHLEAVLQIIEARKEPPEGDSAA